MPAAPSTIVIDGFDLKGQYSKSQFIPGIGIGGPVGMVRFAMAKRRVAAKYLADRNLDRPRLPWDELRALKAQVKRGRF